MSKIILQIILCFFCAPSLQAYAGEGAETRALDVLIAMIEGARLYQARIKIECLSFTKEKETRSYFDFKVYENHQGKNCRGEAGIAPLFDRFRVLKKTNKILLYHVAKDQFLPLGDAIPLFEMGTQDSQFKEQ